MNPTMLQRHLPRSPLSAPDGAVLNGLDSFAGPVPVGSLPNDEDLLVNALITGRQTGLNQSQALNDLHTVGFFLPT